jgi:GT2 family glycosyltransferase
MENWPVSIVIPNYNGEQILPRALASVNAAAGAYPGQAEIIVVDDASQDNSVEFIVHSFPDIRLVRHETNKGFAEAVHSGVNAALHPIILLLNSDVYPERGFVAPLVQWFSRDDTFSVSPLILDPQGSPARISWNLVSLIRGEIRSRNWDLSNAMKRHQEGEPLKSLFASGGSAAIRKDMFLQLNGFLSVYQPFYYEDRDLGTRAWQRGWKTYFEPRSRVVHDHSSTIKRFFSVKKTKIIRKRNRLFYLWLHLSKRRLILSHIPWIFVRLISRMLRLEGVYALALVSALMRVTEIARLRATPAMDAADRKPLEDILADITH